MPDFAAITKRIALALLTTAALCAAWAIYGHGGDLSFAAICFAVPLAGLNCWLVLRENA